MAENKEIERMGDTAAVGGRVEVPTDKPSVARMYDYFLGGFHNFAIDREAAARVVAASPDFPNMIRANRAFLRRAVQFLAQQGIKQFIDLGSGVPTVGNVHEIARAINPDSRVVYVDTDPVAVIHSQSILARDLQTIVLQEDIRQPEAILSHPEVQQLIDFAQPVGVLAFAILHLIGSDDQATAIVRFWHNRVRPGSYIAISHATHDSLPADVTAQILGLYAGTTNPTTTRTYTKVAQFFEGLDVVEPGIVFTPLWRPESSDDLFLAEPPRAAAYAGIGRVPERQ